MGRFFFGGPFQEVRPGMVGDQNHVGRRGVRNAIPIYGINGLTEDILNPLEETRGRRVTLVLDSDEAGPGRSASHRSTMFSFPVPVPVPKAEVARSRSEWFPQRRTRKRLTVPYEPLLKPLCAMLNCQTMLRSQPAWFRPALQQLGGWSSLGMVQRYSGSDEDQKMGSRAASRHFPTSFTTVPNPKFPERRCKSLQHLAWAVSSVGRASAF
jgi:hypothetical protein